MSEKPTGGESEDCLAAENSPIQESKETFSQATLGDSQILRDSEQKVLGVTWNVTTDQIIFSLHSIAELAREMNPTRRNIISLIGKFYDPLGFLAPIVITLKIFMHALCQAKVQWDESIPEELLATWNNLVHSLIEAQPLTFPDVICSPNY